MEENLGWMHFLNLFSAWHGMQEVHVGCQELVLVLLFFNVFECCFGGEGVNGALGSEVRGKELSVLDVLGAS